VTAQGEQLKQVNNGETFELTSQILEFCRHIAGSSKIAAVVLVDNYSMKTLNERTIYEVLLVIQDFPPRLMRYVKTVNNKTIFVFGVDKWIFERDIDRGFLGEAIASKLIFPHLGLDGNDYLHEREIALKKRLILELLENLVVNFPELANRIQIKPQYFMYEVFSNRIRVFPLIAYDLAKLKCNLQQNEEQTLSSYNKALKQLEAEEKINLSNDYVTISKKFIKQCQNPKIKIINLSKNMPRTLFTSIFGVLPQLLNIVSQNTEDFLKTQKINWTRQPDPTCRFIDPQKYVFFPTSGGLVSLSDKIDIKGFAQRMLLKGQNDNIKVEPVGGMLNDVYLINAYGNGDETKVLAKRFKDWSGLKWFPLTLWSFGARSFAVSGQARLAKECAINEFLRSEGFNVPKILHVSNAERIVFMEYIDGENLSEDIKRVATSTDPANLEDVLRKVGRVGEILAKVHSFNVSLGDTKPDNVLIKPDGTIFLIDFEQATQDGDKAWDIGVFLYYSGHYLQPYYSNVKSESVAKAFIAGYLKGGGSVLNVRKAGEPKYTRVFSIFTPQLIMRAISDVCKKTQGTEEQMHG
jgi:tRNA A-37 threonylcarbamoyl transferase component Bud32